MMWNGRPVIPPLPRRFITSRIFRSVSPSIAVELSSGYCGIFSLLTSGVFFSMEKTLFGRE
ncbi:hypothetical protein D3C78_1666250 [compost metagenome]